MKKKQSDQWKEYYQLNQGRNPRRLLLEALPYAEAKQTALDLGAGDLVDSKFLLDQGFKVVAVDSSPSAEEASQALTSQNFTFIRSTYEEYLFPNNTYDLVSAQFALPFNPPESFDKVFNGVKKALKTGGVFAGHFFGVHDEWNVPHSNMSFHDKTAAEKFLIDMEIILLKEIEEDKETAADKIKHWHIFEVIARKVS